jgi:hypothetical protein
MFAGFGVVLLIAGAVLRWGIHHHTNGVDWAVIGAILMAGGALSLAIAAVSAAGFMSMGRRRVHTERRTAPDGSLVVEDVKAD